MSDSTASDWDWKLLSDVIRDGQITLGRGDVISKVDIENHPGDYPIYSSSASATGMFGRYGRYMFDEELITWSVDGGGKPFYRAPHKFSVTNVCGFLKIKDAKKWDYRFVAAIMREQHLTLSFDWLLKAHPSVIRDLYRLPAIPLREQRRIADILDTLDDQIRATEQIIAKLKLAKQGLLIDLLTHGISGTGQRRNAVARRHDFAGWPFGLIPRNWQVKPLEDLLSPVDPAMRSGPFGSALLKHELVPKGIPLLGIDNVHVDRFVRHYQRFVTPEKAQELARYRVRPRDVMITIMGTVGRACLVPDDMGDALSSKHVWTMSFDEERYLPYLVSLQLNHSPWARAHLRKDEQGGIMSAIRSGTLRSLPLPVPPIEEQRNIAAVLLEADKRIAGEQAELSKLVLVKNGASTDLLIGRVRVPLEAA